MRNVYAVIRHAMLWACFALAACGTPTQPSASVFKTSPEPAPVFNFQIVSPGGAAGANAVYRSGQPKGDAEWAYLERIGTKTVVKLNELSKDADESEELSLAKKHNINVIPIYVSPEDFPHNWNPWAHPDEKALAQAVETLENNNDLPILVHCSHGKDRTGLVVAVYSVRNKKYCKDAAFNEMKHYGTNPFLFGLKPMLDSPNIVQHPSCTHEFTVHR